MHDQRVKIRSLLDRKNLCHSNRIKGVSRKSVNRLGGQGDNLARSKIPGRSNRRHPERLRLVGLHDLSDK